MAAFPQLGYGYHSNTSHIVKSEPSPIALAWWRNCLTIKQQIELIEKLHPNCHNGSGMLLCGLHITYSKNPQKLYDEWIKKQSI
jgi:hypothetical protein